MSSDKVELNRAVLEFPEGGIWDNGVWSIQFDRNAGPPYLELCRHCRPVDGRKQSHVCPKVVVAQNEGGHNSTGVCLDCILEAAREHGLIDGEEEKA